jgi:rhamnogalacturonyl hydrolase YesR
MCHFLNAGLTDVNSICKQERLPAYLDRANYILTKQLRLPDGTLARPKPRNATLWADDLYMSVPFSPHGQAPGDNKYFDDALNK